MKHLIHEEYKTHCIFIMSSGDFCYVENHFPEGRLWKFEMVSPMYFDEFKHVLVLITASGYEFDDYCYSEGAESNLAYALKLGS